MSVDETKAAAAALNALPDVFLEFSGRGRVRHYIGGGAADPIICPATLAGRNVRECWPQQTADHCVRQIRKALANRKPHKFQLAFDEQGAYEVRLYPRARDRVLAVLRNVEGGLDRTVRERFVDTLTGLSTRERFLVELERVLEQERLRERHLALMYVDIDRFSRINETLGRDTGDAVLRAVASRIQARFRDSDKMIQFGRTREPPILARVGGDKFVMLLSGIGSHEDARNLARRVRESFAEPIAWEQLTIPVEPRIGIALFPQDGDDAEALFASARVAVNQARDYAATTGVFYSGTRLAHERQTDSAQELRWAIEQDQLELHYLPRIRFADDAVTGLEGLLRWRHPMRGLLTADEIIPLAETIGLMGQISDCILEQGCSFARQLDTGCGPPPVLSINLTEREFARPDLAERVGASLDTAGLAANRLQLEITEPALMRYRQGPATVRQLKALGLRVAIDDFGTGHVSLSELAALPIDVLKIDRRFTRAIGSEPVSQTLCAAIIALGRELGLTVIAEGIETPQQHAFLRDLGCDAGQGFLFSRPLPPAEVAAFLSSQSKLPEPSSVS